MGERAFHGCCRELGKGVTQKEETKSQKGKVLIENISYLHLNVLQSYVQLGRVHSAAYCMLLCAHVSLCSGVAFIWMMSLYAAVAASACLWIHEGIAFKYKHMCL